MNPPAVCHVLLAHLPPDRLEPLLQRWQAYSRAPSVLLLCYGGTPENFSKITFEPKIFIDDPRLRTRDHQREKQSYSGLFAGVAAWLEPQPACEYVYVAEFDHWPLVADLDERLIERLKAEDADVMGHELYRRDGTSCPYYLYHLSDARFLPWLKGFSGRTDKGAVFNMFGSGSFWTRAAFLAVARMGEPFPMYLETYLPTVAHHLGFRLRDFQDQNHHISAQGDRYEELEKAKQAGAWTLHPVKTFPIPLPKSGGLPA